mmetsp:Transcript_25571/g.84486  ORF Transcript_25571/g.84486 Transcript_25571/m.84486 type:complete len:314 (-) Transcript_25571:600-1541(-)
MTTVRVLLATFTPMCDRCRESLRGRGRRRGKVSSRFSRAELRGSHGGLDRNIHVAQLLDITLQLGWVGGARGEGREGCALHLLLFLQRPSDLFLPELSSNINLGVLQGVGAIPGSLLIVELMLELVGNVIHRLHTPVPRWDGEHEPETTLVRDVVHVQPLVLFIQMLRALHVSPQLHNVLHVVLNALGNSMVGNIIINRLHQQLPGLRLSIHSLPNEPTQLLLPLMVAQSMHGGSLGPVRVSVSKVGLSLPHLPPVSSRLHPPEPSAMTRVVPRRPRLLPAGDPLMRILQRILPLLQRVLQSIVGVLLKFRIT